MIGDGTTDDGKDFGNGNSILREEAIGSSPILKLGAGGGEQAGHGVASEAKEGAQGEGLRAVGEAALVEGGETLVPELGELGEDASGVFFKARGGG